MSYIAQQEDHHRIVHFQDEVRKFLREYGVKYDERYVWDSGGGAGGDRMSRPFRADCAFALCTLGAAQGWNWSPLRGSTRLRAAFRGRRSACRIIRTSIAVGQRKTIDPW
jgi:hypothetical protein